MKTGWLAVMLSWHLPTLCQAQPVQQVTMYNSKNGEYSYGTIYNPNYYQQLNNQNSGPSVLEVILNASQKSDELDFKKKMAAQEQAARKTSQKRAAEKAKIDAELLGHIRKQSADVFELFDALKGLQPWDAESLKFRNEINKLIQQDLYQAGLVLLELETKLKNALAEAEQKRQNEEYLRRMEASRPKGLGERVKSAFNALFPSEPTAQTTSQTQPQVSQFDPNQPYEIVSDPYQQILEEEAKSLNKKK